MNPLTVLALAVGLLATSAYAQVLPMERRFVEEAARGNLAEVALGKLARERGASPAIREFGRRMVEDHAQAQARLAATMRVKGIPVPFRMSPEAQALYRRLQKLQGAAFDRAYRQAMVADHQQDVAAYERVATRGSDPEIRIYATKTLPALKMHLNMIRATRV